MTFGSFFFSAGFFMTRLRRPLVAAGLDAGAGAGAAFTTGAFFSSSTAGVGYGTDVTDACDCILKAMVSSELLAAELETVAVAALTGVFIGLAGLSDEP